MKQIIMYSTATCPHCVSAKQYLKEKGYKFTIKMVDQDPNARQEMMNLGFMGVPSFVIGEESFSGFDRERIDQLIDYSIISCPNCGQKMRAPKEKKNLLFTCPSCEKKFSYKI